MRSTETLACTTHHTTSTSFDPMHKLTHSLTQKISPKIGLAYESTNPAHQAHNVSSHLTSSPLNPTHLVPSHLKSSHLNPIPHNLTRMRGSVGDETLWDEPWECLCSGGNGSRTCGRRRHRPSTGRPNRRSYRKPCTSAECPRKPFLLCAPAPPLAPAAPAFLPCLALSVLRCDVLGQARVG